MNDYPIVLGINYGGHDTSACLLKNGKLIAACEEERYSKIKHTREFPINAINDCLKKAKIVIFNLKIIKKSCPGNLLTFFLLQFFR